MAKKHSCAPSVGTATAPPEKLASFIFHTSYDVWKMKEASFSGGAVAVPTLGAHECFFAILSPSSERSAA